MSKVITKSNFNEEVINSDKPILVDFFSKTCGPCRMLAPVLDAIAVNCRRAENAAGICRISGGMRGNMGFFDKKKNRQGFLVLPVFL